MRNERNFGNVIGRCVIGIVGGFFAGGVTGIIIGNIGEGFNKALNEPLPPGFILERSIETFWIIAIPIVVYVSLTEPSAEST